MEQVDDKRQTRREAGTQSHGTSTRGSARPPNHGAPHELLVRIGTSLVRIDPATLDTVTFGEPGTLPAGVEHLVWQGDDLYASVDADLYRIVRVGLP